MRDITGKLLTPNSHVDGENDAKIMVYNMKRKPKERRRKKKASKVEEIQQ